MKHGLETIGRTFGRETLSLFAAGFAALMSCSGLAEDLIVNVGDGADGDIEIAANQSWGAVSGVFSSRIGNIEQTNVAVVDASGFKPGDEILIYVYQASSNSQAQPGQFETRAVTGVTGGNFVGIDRALNLDYDPQHSVVLAHRVPHFRNFTIDTNVVLTVPAWDGKAGGLLFLRAREAVNIAGSISANGSGFPGGSPTQGGGYNGVSYYTDALGGAGAGAPGWWTAGSGARLDPDLSFGRVLLGSGGGGGGQSSLGLGGYGGAGGGLVYLSASEIGFSGSIDVSGSGGYGGGFGTGGGGGGSGGTVWLQCENGLGITGSILRSGCSGYSPDHGIPSSGGSAGISRVDAHYLVLPNNGIDLSEFVGAVVTNASAAPSDAPAMVVSDSKDQLVSAGATVTLTVQTSGWPSPRVEWFLNGANIMGASGSTYSIDRLRVSDAGVYEVVATNSFGSSRVEVATVTMLPTLISPFTGLTGIWGRPATLSVGAVGSGTLAFQWIKDGVPVAGASSSDLVFTNLQFADAGSYSVVVASPFGSVTNSPAQLIVNPAGAALGLHPFLLIEGVVGHTYLIQASSSLADSAAWTTRTNLTLAQPAQEWIDTSVDAASGVNPRVFYRVLPGN